MDRVSQLLPLSLLLVVDNFIDKQDAETVRGITKPEIQEFYRTKIHTSSTERSKLVVQLFARSGSQPDEANSVTEGREPTVIKDVRKYKAGLVASTGPRPARDVTEFEEL